MPLEDTIGLLEELAAIRKSETAAALRRGRKVIGYLCAYVPHELIRACGAIPVRLAHGGNRAGRTRGERYVRIDACPFCRDCLGQLEDEPELRELSALVVASPCDQVRRLPEVLGLHFGIQVLHISVPRTRTSELTQRLFRQEVRKLAAELEVLTGNQLTGEGLARTMLDEEEKRARLRAINELRKDSAPVVSQSQMLRLVAAADVLSGPDCVALLRQSRVALEIDKRVRLEQQSDRRPRLLLAGSLLACGDLDLVKMIEERADIVADLLCTGTRCFHSQLDVPQTRDRDRLLDALADFHYRAPSCIHERPNRSYYGLARRLTQDYRVQGAVYRSLLFCDGYEFEAVRLERELKIPFLHISGDYGDLSQERLRTRVESFLETLSSAAG
ncbi:MAG: 2-hydroxyacyl-CoA dehydratase family protein [candidate division WOR-3 bacterium]